MEMTKSEMSRALKQKTHRPRGHKTQKATAMTKSETSGALRHQWYSSDLDICGEDVVLVEAICTHIGSDVLLQSGLDQLHHHHLVQHAECQRLPALLYTGSTRLKNAPTP